MFFYLFFALFLFSSCTGGNYVPLIEPPPKELAKLIPMQRDEIVFAYEIWLDASFTEKGTQSFAAKVSKSDLPKQIVRSFHRNYKRGETWYAGFNVWKYGEDYFYESFVGRDWKPAVKNHRFSGRVGGKHRGAGSTIKMGGKNGRLYSIFSGFKKEYKDDHQYGTITVVPQDWKFEAAITSAFVDTTLLTNVMRPKIAKNSIYDNTDSSRPVTFSPTVAWKKKNTYSHSVSDKHHWNAGVTIKNKIESKVPPTKASIEWELSFSYGQEKTTTSAHTQEEEYTIKEGISISVPARKRKYLSLIVWVAKGAKVPLVVDFQLSATRGGKPVSGQFLATLAKAMVSDTKVTEVKANEISYRVYGTMDFDLATTSIIKVTDKPLTDEDLKKMSPE